RHAAILASNCAEQFEAQAGDSRLERCSYPRLVPESAIAHPLTIIAASEARNNITSAIASGGVHCEASSSGMAAQFCGVSMIVGITQPTQMPCGRSSAAMLSVSRTTAFFAKI